MYSKVKHLLKKVRNKWEWFSSVKIQYKRYNFKKKNTIAIHNTCRIRNTTFTINGKNNTIEIDAKCEINGVRFLILGDNNRIYIGEGTIINATPQQPTIINVVEGTTVSIGKGCLFSNSIELHTSDYHGIYNSKGERINAEKNITIGSGVWIGLRTIILKGTEVGQGNIIGANSLLVGSYPMTNSIIAGSPAKVICQNVIWNRYRKPQININ